MWNFEKNFSKTAVIDDRGNNLSYKDLSDISNILYSKINSRCVVMQFAENTIGSLAGYLSFLENKIVPIMVSSSLNLEQKKFLIKNYQPKYLWLPNDLIDDFQTYDTIFSIFDYSLLKTEFSADYKLFDDLALLLTTSGTTGSQKFVRQSYLNIQSNTDAIVSYLNITDEDRAITSLPMHYTFGLSVINTHIKSGATILLTDKSIMQKEFWSFFKEQCATTISGVPYTYEMLKRLKIQSMNLPSLKVLTQAGGKLPVELHKYFAEYALDNNKKFYVMYGQCEATSRMGYLPWDMSLKKIGSIGIPLPGGEYFISDGKSGFISSCDTEGELVFKGNNVTLGYAQSYRDLSLGDERKGCLYTGDIAYFDKDHYFYITGRNNRYIKIFGNRINLDEVENILKKQFKDQEVAVIGKYDLICVCIVANDLLQNEITAYLSGQLHIFHSAIKITEVDNIPKNESGKIIYHKLASALL